MPQNVTIIGRSTRVRGRVTGGADVEVHGFVEGEIAVSGDVTIDATGMVGAGVQCRKLVVRGAVKGDLVGEEAVLLEEGSRVVGDVRAPRVAIAPGALVRGYVQTGQQRSTAPRAQASASAAKPVAAVPVRVPVAAAAPKAAARAPAPVLRAASASAAATGKAAVATAPRRPPPPIVPALKKAKGQMAKKREH
jgi:cytoskeletal protein CcmA (bactofilin family)